jgi:hypothetical protein
MGLHFLWFILIYIFDNQLIEYFFSKKSVNPLLYKYCQLKFNSYMTARIILI